MNSLLQLSDFQVMQVSHLVSELKIRVPAGLKVLDQLARLNNENEAKVMHKGPIIVNKVRPIARKKVFPWNYPQESIIYLLASPSLTERADLFWSVPTKLCASRKKGSLLP